MTAPDRYQWRRDKDGLGVDPENGPGLLSPTRRTRDVGAAATSGDRM